MSRTVVPFCSSCYLKNFIHSVEEALYDPVLPHSLRFDSDMNLYACVRVRACLRARVRIRDLPWRAYIISDQCLCCLASWLIHPFPLERPSFYCSTSNSLACYHDKKPFYHPRALTIALSQFSHLSTGSQLSLTLYPV